MAIEITTPSLGTAKKTTKDLVISTLMYEYPLTLAKITNSIKKKFHASVTFQGVRKAVNQLVENEVIVKIGEKSKHYQLNKEWIVKLRDFAEQMHESYYSKSKGIREVEAIGEDIKVYTFDNLIDLDKFWDKLITRWFEADKDNPKKKVYAQLSGHTWYVLGQLGEETAILETIKKHNINFYIFANDNTFLDRWSKKYYNDLGFHYTTNKSKKRNTNARYFSVYNDLIVQAEYPQKIADEIDEVYNNTKDFESFDATKLIRILREKAELKVTVMRNPIVAEQLRESILRHFKK
ncbi:hypothetical protein HOC35_04775 [Candidatus Woesearchaeota archaeon]|jgi:hypothetical protein|nr:hypothetical protein [Candidatus Woesearchaeota archaeon]